MFGFFKRRERLAGRIERLIESDLDKAASVFAEYRRDIRAGEASKISARLRHALDARDNNEYLSRALAEEAITPAAAGELLEVYEAAGYVTPDQYSMHYRHIVEAYRREFVRLLEDPNVEHFDYFRRLDSYRSAGHLSEHELADLEGLLEAKINPQLAARRLFDRARTSPDEDLQEDLLHRYLMEFVGFADFPEAASLYLSHKINDLWIELPTVRTARIAAGAVHTLNNLLEAYLPYTSDLSLTVPIDKIVHEFRVLAKDFKPEPDAVRPITPQHIHHRVVVVKKLDGVAGGYEEERNSLFSKGAKGRVQAVRDDFVFVEHGGDCLPYSRIWKFEAFQGSPFAQVRPDSSFAVWRQEEVGLVRRKRVSPIFTHQYRDAVNRMAELLEAHRAHNPPPTSVPVTGDVRLPPAGPAPACPRSPGGSITPASASDQALLPRPTVGCDVHHGTLGSRTRHGRPRSVRPTLEHPVRASFGRASRGSRILHPLRSSCGKHRRSWPVRETHSGCPRLDPALRPGSGLGPALGHAGIRISP